MAVKVLGYQEPAAGSNNSTWSDDNSSSGRNGNVRLGDGGGKLVEQHEVFGSESKNGIEYKTLSWQMVATLMIAEVVSNGVLSLPSGGGVIGIVPTVILIAFFGVFGTFTGYMLIQFKLHHPKVHNMGDAGHILFGRFGMELFTYATFILTVLVTGSQLLAGQLALKSLSDHKLCSIFYTGIFSVAALLGSFPRTFGELTWLSCLSVGSTLLAGIVGMVGAGLHPVASRSISAALSPSFQEAFISVTNPIFAYAGHFAFFILMSEMTKPEDAYKAIYVLQGFATSFYLIFTIVTFYYLGDGVASPSFLDLPEKWQKAAWGLAIPSFLATACLVSHTGAKLLFVRIFRGTDHLQNNTVKGRGVWTTLIVVVNAVAFVLAVAIPIFNSIIGLASSLFASWFTYGVSGMFWLHDAWYLKDEKFEGWKRRPIQTLLCFVTVLVTTFVCGAGTYVTIKGVIDAYNAGSKSPLQETAHNAE